METVCPYCHQRHQLPDAAVKSQVRCANCRRPFIANPVSTMQSASAPTVLLPPVQLPATTSDPEDLLAGYRATRKKHRSGLQAMLVGGVRGLRERTGAQIEA